MITIKVATTNTRGFLRNLFEAKFDNIEFHYQVGNFYEINNKSRKLLVDIVKWPIFDILGVFQVISVKDVKEDICFSYNRFLKTNRPYVILLENPAALVNYCWERPKYPIAKYRLKKCFSDPNLKGIVCMSQTCYRYIDNLYKIPENVNIIQNYPLVPDDMSYNMSDMSKVIYGKTLECLFISSNFELKGGRDIVSVLKKLETEKLPIHVTLITIKSTIRDKDLKDLNELKNATVVNFGLSKKELSEYYKKSAILLNPTRMDSFSLVTLEALKYGCAILATDVYAIKEMDRDGYNGFLTQSMFEVWDADGKIKKKYRKDTNELVLSGEIDTQLVEWMYDKLKLLTGNRELLEKMCCNSLKLARETDFSEENIKKKWEDLLKK